MKHEDELHTLTAAYVLDALGPAEHEAFARHLVRCAPCSGDVAGFSATAGRLAGAVALAPPPHMKAAVLARIETVRRLPPRVGVRRAAGFLDRLPRKAGAFVVAASLVGAAVLGGAALRQAGEADRARLDARQAVARSQELRAVVTAPDARTVHGRTSGGAAATVITSPARDRAVFLTDWLPAAGAGRTYQLWLADRGTMRPAGFLTGDGAAVLTGGLGSATAVGLTLEPTGGSPRPTTSPLVLLALPA
ncbi:MULTISPECIES: anti-sigma factor [unclassified Streptomyces]|uniref:anti-sigma factor n=1 Tax=unclassified Streptomyces TaxID=2593676 RepID=UPI000DC79ACF|nr:MULTISPECIES: anti-sigma factor [unclassified Streptomyces]AWZ06373.1 anti-sigma factor [Streptomyces sp. ICC4]AWZ14221.1 anti-sigma factor [Streptomyces sp. ICC1]